MPSDTITTAITTLKAYAEHCHDETAQAGGVVVQAYEELEAEREKLERRLAHRDAQIEHLTASSELWRMTSGMEHGAIDRLTQSSAELRGTVEMMGEALLSAEAEVAELRAALEQATAILQDIVTDEQIDPCWYDHHDHCQAHGLQPKGECYMELTRAFLGAQRGEVG